MLSVKQAAGKTGVCPSIVYGWVSSGELPHFRLGAKGRRGAIRILEADLEAFLATLKKHKGQQATTPTAPRHKITLKNLRMPS